MDNQYYEGQGCACFARSQGDCSCENADWTPKEVYTLRKRVAELEGGEQENYALMLHEVANRYDGNSTTEWSIGANHVFVLFCKWVGKNIIENDTHVCNSIREQASKGGDV
jgi:hypothetical protein